MSNEGMASNIQDRQIELSKLLQQQSKMSAMLKPLRAPSVLNLIDQNDDSGKCETSEKSNQIKQFAICNLQFEFE